MHDAWEERFNDRDDDSVAPCLDILNHLSTILSIYEHFIHMDIVFATCSTCVRIYTDLLQDGLGMSAV
jgi:hypothetical protein